MCLVVSDIDKGGDKIKNIWLADLKNVPHFICQSSRETRYHIFTTGRDWKKTSYDWGDVLGSKSYEVIYRIEEVSRGIRNIKGS